MGTARYGTESLLESYIILKDMSFYVSCCVTLASHLTFLSPGFPQLLSEELRENDLQDHLSSNI